MSLYRIKPLEWKHWFNGAWAKPPLGNEFHVFYENRTWNWKVYDNVYQPCDSLEAGKAVCEAIWRAKLAEVLEEVPDAAIKEMGDLIEAAEQFVEVADLGPSTEAYDDSPRKLKAAIKAASEVPEGWQPIETAPKDGTNILVWCPERNRVYLVYWDEFADGWFAFTDRFISKAVSHWMPLPKPPAGGPKEGK